MRQIHLHYRATDATSSTTKVSVANHRSLLGYIWSESLVARSYPSTEGERIGRGVKRKASDADRQPLSDQPNHNTTIHSEIRVKAPKLDQTYTVADEVNKENVEEGPLIEVIDLT